MSRIRNNNGFTLAEVILVLLIAGILISVALTSGTSLQTTARVEDAKEELNSIAVGIVGDEQLHNNGTQSDFGYVGDVGSLPSSLDALVSNPGYATWDGPYVNVDITQDANDFKTDPWGAAYTYTGGVEVSSSGGGSPIVRKIANSTSDLLGNSASGTVLDMTGSPPGTIYADSVTVRLTFPDGSGGMNNVSVNPDAAGNFSFNSLPIGNHDLSIVYLPTADTLSRFVAVSPAGSGYAVYRLNDDYWKDTTTYSGGGGSGSLQYVSGSASVGGGGCNDVSFQLENTSGSDVTLSSLIASWGTPTAYFKKITIDGSHVVNANPRIASGELAAFSSDAVIAAGGTVTVSLDLFKVSSGGGPNVDMSNVDFTIQLSDGSTISFNTGSC